MKTKTSVFAIFLLAAIPIIFFFQALFGDKALVNGDLFSFFYPIKTLIGEMYRSGRLFLWDPYIFSGMPMGAETQTAVFYPLNALFAVLPALKAISYFVALHLFLAALFMYLYLREMKLNTYAALLGAFVFSYNGYSLMHAEQISILSAGAYLPLILLLLERSFRSKGVLFPVLAGIAVGLQFLAGHPQVSAFTAVAAVFYVSFKLFRPLSKKDFKEAKRMALISISIAVIGAALAMVTVLPFLEAYSQSMRAGGGIEASSAIYVSPAELHTFLVPELRAKEGMSGATGGTGETYAGVVPVMLAVFAVVFIKEEIVAFNLGLGLFSILAAFGKAFPLHYLLYYLIPFYGNLQIPIRFMFLYMFSVSVLSAVALDRLSGAGEGLQKFSRWLAPASVALSVIFLMLISLPGARDLLTNSTEGGLFAPLKFLVLLGAFAVCLKILIAQKPRYPVLAAVLIVLTLADLLSFGSRFFQLGDETAARSIPPAFQFLERDRDLYRVSIGTESVSPNLGMVYGVQNIGGYSPAILNDYIHYLMFNSTHSLDFSGIPTDARVYIPPDSDTAMTGLLNVKYHVYDMVRDGMYYVGISPRKNNYGRTFLVPGYSVLPSRNAILESLADASFNPRKAVLLESGGGLSQFKFVPQSTGSAEVVLFSPDRIDIKTRSNDDAFLFLSEIYFPGWKAYVDGMESKIFRADFIFRAIPLRAGEHNVSFVYDPLSFKVGKYVSLLSLVMCLGLIGHELVILRRARNG